MRGTLSGNTQSAGKYEMQSLIRFATIGLVLAGSVSYAAISTFKSDAEQTTRGNIAEVADNSNPSASFKAGANKVTFQSEGVKMVGNLYLPASYKPGDKLPALVVAGSWTSVKEQMSGLYAQKLAEQGFATLAFDFRFFGESGGEPRYYESPQGKIQDIKNAVTFLQSLPIIDRDRIGGLAVCASAGYMAHAIAEGAGINSFATVAAWLHDPQTVPAVYGGQEGVRQRIELGLAARQKYEQTGKVEYVPAHSETDPKAAMYSQVDYYSNPTRGEIPEWTNQFAVMSWSEWLQFDALAAAPKITVPTRFVHSDNSALPDNVRKFYRDMPGSKDLFWTQGQHTDFYDKQPYVNRAVQAVAEHFKNTLSDAQASR